MKEGYVKYNVRNHREVLSYQPTQSPAGINQSANLCRYCPNFWHQDATEVNLHQSQAHPNAYPCVVNVKNIVGKQRAEMYMCPDLACTFKDRMCSQIYDHVLEEHYAGEFACMLEKPGVVHPPDQFSGIRYSRKSHKLTPKKKDKLTIDMYTPDDYENASGPVSPSLTLVDDSADDSMLLYSVHNQDSSDVDYVLPQSEPSPVVDVPLGKVGSGRVSKSKAAFKIAKAIEMSGELTGSAVNILRHATMEPARYTPEPVQSISSAKRKSKPANRPKVVPCPEVLVTNEELELAEKMTEYFDVEEPDRIFLADGRWKGYVDKASDLNVSQKKRFLCLICQADVMSLSRGKAHCLTHHQPSLADLTVCIIDKSKQRLRKKTRVYLCKEAKCPFFCKNDLNISRHICGAPFAEQQFCISAVNAQDKAKAITGNSPLPYNEVIQLDENSMSVDEDESEAKLEVDAGDVSDTAASPPPLLISEPGSDSATAAAVKNKAFTALKKRLTDHLTESESDGEVASPALPAVVPGNESDVADSLPVLERERSLSPPHTTSDASQESDLQTKRSGSEVGASESDSEVRIDSRTANSAPAPAAPDTASEDSMPDLSHNDYEDMPVLFDAYD